MRWLVPMVLAVTGLACASAPVAAPWRIVGPIGHALPIFNTTYPARCVELAELQTAIPPDRDEPGLFPDGESRAIGRLARAAVVNGGDALLLVQAEGYPDNELHGRALQCGL